MKRLSILLAALAFGAQWVAAKHVAVLFTDVKFDDKLAIHALYHSGDFDQIIAVLSCVENQAAAHGDLLDFMSQMNDADESLYGPGMLKSNPEMNVDRKSRPELVVLKGDNVKEKEAPHEPNFLGSPVESDLTYNKDTINEFLQKGTTVEIFHIAPALCQQPEILAEMDDIDITLYHLIHGYNSIQNAENYGGPASFNFVTQIGPIIRKKHPEARIVFTHSLETFLNKEGGIQPYANLKDGPVPADHLEAALNDPFYVRQFTLAARILDEAKLIIVINQLKRAAYLVSQYSGVPSLGTEKFPLKDLPKNVFRAGMQLAYKTGIDQDKLAKRQEEDAAISSHYIKFIDDVLVVMKNSEHEKEKTLMENLDKFVREFLLGKVPLISPHAKYLSGELPVKKLSDDKNWIDQMKNVGVVKEEKEFGDYEDVLYYPAKAIIEELDEDNYQSDKNEWHDYNYKGIFDLLLRARKNLEDEISEKLRQNILDFVEAISPIVFDYHPQTHNGLCMRFKNNILTAFKSDLTVEVCDANHVLVVRDAIKTANNGGIDKFEKIGFAFDAAGLIIFKFEKVKINDNFVWNGQTLTGLRAADSYKLLEPYLLRRKDDAPYYVPIYARI